MKKGIRWIAALLAAGILLGLSGCSKHPVTVAGENYEIEVRSGNFAIKVGDYTVSVGDYKRKIANLRQENLETIITVESEEFWQSVGEDGKTVSDGFIAQAQQELIEDALLIDQFDRLGLEFTEEMEEQVQRTMRELVASYGGMSGFTSNLQNGYYTYDEFQKEQRNEIKRRAVLDYYFKDVTDEMLEEEYASHNALIRHIYFSKMDTETEEALSDAELAKVKALAEEVYESAKRPSEKDLFSELVKIHSDNVFSDDFDVVPDTDEAKKEFREKVFSLKIGEVALIEGETEYIIVKRYDPIAEEYFNEAMKYELLRTLCADRLNVLLKKWAAEASMEINLDAVAEIRPEMFMQQY